MAPLTRHEEEESTHLSLCSMLYALMKGAALGIAPAKIAALPLEHVLRFAADAVAIAANLGGTSLAGARRSTLPIMKVPLCSVEPPNTRFRC